MRCSHVLMSIKPTPARCLQRRSFEQRASEGTKIIKETDPSHKTQHLYTMNNPLHSYLKTYPKPISTETSNPIMQLQTLLSCVVALMMAVSAPSLCLKRSQRRFPSCTTAPSALEESILLGAAAVRLRREKPVALRTIVQS